MWTLEIENIGGITQGTAELAPGINAVQASNWQGKSSLIGAMQAVMGTETPLQDGAEEGRVTLTTDDAEYEVRFTRRGEDVVRRGTPYLDDERARAVGDLFAFLDETNPIRQAVRNGDDLTPLFTRPLDLENLDERIADLRAERKEVETELERAEESARQLPAARERVADLEAELETLQAELADLEDGPDASDPSGSELQQKRTERESADRTVTKLTREIEQLEGQLEDANADLEAIDVPDADGLEDRLADARADRREAERELELLRNLYQANKELLDEGGIDLVAEIDRQLEADRVECWVCGGETTVETVRERLGGLSEAITDRRERVAALEERVEELEARRRDREEQRRRKQDLTDRIDHLESRLEDRRAALEDAKARRETLTEEIEALEARQAADSERRRTVERELAETEAALEDAREELQRHERRSDQRETLRSRIEEIEREIEALRQRREAVIEDARAAFEAAMEDVFETFAPSFGGARLKRYTDDDTGETERLELVIAREGREITVDALSEGEVELVGFMTALAGYEAFDAAEEVPVILIDEIGGLAAEHLHSLVEYFEARASIVVTTAYPTQGPFDGRTLSPDDWEVISDRAAPT